ncbi:MAG: hypothetical protein AAF715_01260 [Myxococcota bacterium]
MRLLPRPHALARSWRRAGVVSLGLIAAAATTSCEDPLRERQIAELGPEEANFPPSAIHRVGQPCVLCHSDYLGAEPQMVFGGTVFLEPDPEDPEAPLVGVPGYEIRLLDSRGQITPEGLITTNECGNFWVTEEQFKPAYPVRTEIHGPSLNDAERRVQISSMSTRIGRDGSCGGCHAEPRSPLSPGAIFIPRELFNADAITIPDPGACPPPRFRPTVPETLDQ